MKYFLKRLLSLFTVTLVAVSAVGITASADWSGDIDLQIETETLNKSNSYSYYKEKHIDKPFGVGETVIKSDEYTALAPDSDIKKADNYEGRTGVTVWGNSPDWAEWSFETESDGLYELVLVYYPLKKSQRLIELALKIDGKFPFSEATAILLNGAYESEYPIRQDELGNDYNSSQIEIKKWYEEPISGDDGIESDPFRFYLTKGTHKLNIFLMQETFALSEIRLVPVKEYISYSEYSKDFSENDTAKDYSKMYQAEDFISKSTSSIVPDSSRNSSHNVPFSYSKLKLNIISGESWSKAGQWIEYKIDIPYDGWYSFNFRYSQSYNKNMPVYRRLYIDGEVPFKEADLFSFEYNEGWELANITDEHGNEAYIHLKKGEHTIRLEAVMGDIKEVISDIGNVVYKLSNVYQRINMITGANPDQYRDYNLDANVPDMLDVFEECSKVLKESNEIIKEISGGRGSSNGIIGVLAYQLDDMIAAPSSVPMRLSTLSSNISGLSSAAEELKSQAMDLDYILITSVNTQKPKVNDNIFESVKRGFLCFVSSFFEDYNSFSLEGDKDAITVWANTGRDQAQVITRMVNDMFVPEYGIRVNFKLVTASLIQAFLSGDPPDAMIMTERGQPVNLAIRGALADLSKFSDFASVKDEFQKDALTPYFFNDGCYGLPDSQSFFMMFYRRDILNELGIKIPETWDELFEVMQILHINNMDVGLPYAGIGAAAAVNNGLSNTNIFSALLLQNGGSYYNEDNTKTALTTPAATKAFTQWTDYYTEYGIPMSYNFFNRFRTGTMPIGIATYTTYNQIYVAAPEIRNLWGMTRIPGTVMSDGSINRTQAAAGTASIITSTSKNKESAWKFLKWWVGSEAQTRYSTDIESILGMAARYPTANVSAFGNIQWSRNEFSELSSQWKEVTEIPEIPGSYYTVRDVDNAFRSVVLNGKNPKEVLIEYSRSIDSEIARKRGEFSLDSQ